MSPSLLSADFLNLERDVRLIEQAGPEFLHVDVMDGHFVPNLTVGPPIVKALKAITQIPLDVHLMVANPAAQLDWYIDAGADLISFHIETAGTGLHLPVSIGTSNSIDEVSDDELVYLMVDRIKKANRLVGIAVSPNTPVHLVFPYLSLIDSVMVMSVHPGFGGQSFLISSLQKIEALKNEAAAQKIDLVIEVDGGINAETAVQAVSAGANMLVAGNAIFGENDPLSALKHLRQLSNNLPS